MGSHLTAIWDVTCHMGSQCYLLPDTSERAPPLPQPVSWYSIYLPRKYGRLSWPRRPGNAPAGSRTRDLSITSPTPCHYTTEPDDKMRTNYTNNNLHNKRRYVCLLPMAGRTAGPIKTKLGIGTHVDPRSVLVEVKVIWRHLVNANKIP